ncbi:acyl-CoA dehydrogenase family protein [Sphingopyxis kveilinensis]|uniref:acyl-CoA dehydrogenase family protein n=1 Tax=Sphingopyxis kveilinensis TaxID=3114367 RepID=UPI0030D416DA
MSDLLSADLVQFRDDVRAFFRDEFPSSLIAKAQQGQSLTKADYVQLEQALARRGWLAANWPKAHGGTGWSAIERFIFEEEMERAGAPELLPMGLLYVAPVIFTFGSEAQKARWLPDILSSRTFWAQGYSEPEAGSDLTALSTRAVRDGDAYFVTGTKIWTSHASHADWIFCLVRTSDEGRKSHGISFLCIDLATAGIEVRPISSIDGGSHLHSVHFDNVRVPAENLIGEEGQGWTYAKYLLQHERTSYAHVAGKQQKLQRLKHWLAEGAGGNDPVLTHRVAELEIDLLALEYMALRALLPLESGAAPGLQSSVIKVRATELAQDISELYLDAAGAFGIPFITDRNAADWAAPFAGYPPFALRAASDYFFDRAQTIYGGSTEIQKTIIAKFLF